MNWVDAVVLAYVALGAWRGLRLGLLGALGALVSYAVAFWASVRFAAPALAFVDARWHVQARVAGWLAHAVPLPALGGATPWPALYRPQLGPAGAIPSLASAEAAASSVLLHYVAFGVIFVLAHALLWLILRPLVLRRPHGLPGLANRVAGLCVGGVERVVIAAVVVAIMVGFGAFPPLAPLLAAMSASRSVPLLLKLFHTWEPAAAHWWSLLA